MKKTGFKNKPRKPLKQSGFQQAKFGARSGLRRTKIRIVGASTTTELKREIQAILNAIVKLRDGGCILRTHADIAGACGSRATKDGHMILQAEHLITRSNAASFADTRLVVCLCERHHIFWKPQHSDEYNTLVRKIIGKQRKAISSMLSAGYTKENSVKILNLYANIGGNRKLWGDEHEITSVEIDPKIAAIYQDFWPNDTVVVADAHEYLQEHYAEFDFIWSSPPCPSHSKIRHVMSETYKAVGGHKAIYPDMKLYEEILFLQGYFKGKYCVENVIAWYDPLIRPTKMGGHYFWTNFSFPAMNTDIRAHDGTIEELQKRKGFDLSKYSGIDKRLMLRDITEPELGKYILDWSVKDQVSLFT